jgi:hypothetical protein
MNKQCGKRGGRTVIHVRHLPRLPIGNVGIEGTSTLKHYPPPETSNTMDTRRWRAINDPNNNNTGVNLKKNQNNKSVTRPTNKQCGTEVDVLPFMFVTSPVCHLEMSALNAAVFINTTHHPKRRKQWTRKGEGQEMINQTANTAGGELKINQKTNQ